MNMKKLLFSLPIAALPAVAFALNSSQPLSSLGNFLQYLTSLIVNSVIPLIFSLAVVFFLWGVAMYIKNADDATKRAEGRQYMLYGVIGLFVLVAYWGLVGILARTVGVPLNVPLAPRTQAKAKAPPAFSSLRDAELSTSFLKVRPYTEISHILSNVY